MIARVPRRRFLRQAGAALAFSPWVFGRTNQLTAGARAREVLLAPRPTRSQRLWQDCEVGIIYHCDLPIAAGQFAANNSLRDRLVRMYRESVGRNCNLVIGEVITSEGLVPASDISASKLSTWANLNPFGYGLRMRRPSRRLGSSPRTPPVTDEGIVLA